MSDLARFNDPVWDRFFTFVQPDEELASRQEVQDELRRLGISTGKALQRVKMALQSVPARAQLEEARARRPGLLAALGRVAAPAVEGLREALQEVIARTLSGPQRAVAFRKLESAATEADLRALLEDIHRLDALEGGHDDASPSGQ